MDLEVPILPQSVIMLWVGCVYFPVPGTIQVPELRELIAKSQELSISV
jgi:hypothetical protein